MASVMYAGGRAVGVRAYGGIDPITKKTRNLYLPLPIDATTEEIATMLDRVDRLANFSKNTGKAATVGPLVTFYVDFLELNGAAPGTVSSYRSNIRCYIEPFIDDLSLDKADTFAWTSLYMQLLQAGGKDKRPLSGATIIKLNSWLKGFYRFMIENGFADSNPLLSVRTPKYVKPEVEVVRPDEYAILYSYITNRIASGEAHTLDYAVFLVMGTGIRGGEVAALRIDNFFPKKSEIFVKKSLAENSKKTGIKRINKRLIRGGTKNDKFRKISIDESRTKAIEKHLKNQKKILARKGKKQTPRTPLFARSDGTPYRARTFNDHFKKILKKLGLSQNLHLHCLRHTHFSALLEADLSLIAAQNRAGHYSASVTTNEYGHVLRDDDTRSAEEFSKFEQEVLKAHEEAQRDH